MEMTFEDAAQLQIGTRAHILDNGKPLNIAPGVNLEVETLDTTSGELNIDCGLFKVGDKTVLVVTGSTPRDYIDYNFRPFGILRTKGIKKSDSTAEYKQEFDELLAGLALPANDLHFGFLLLAARVLWFVKKNRTAIGTDKPDFIVGHSLGAAACQILGAALDVPTICFASPQVVKRKAISGDDNPFRASAHSQWKIFNVVWKKDFVTRGYRALRYRSLGHREVLEMHENYRVKLKLAKPKLPIHHFMADYLSLLKIDRAKPYQQVSMKWWDGTRPIPPEAP
ncbi:MAG: hypothetical protein AAGF71_13570 [Pseudomonadota bacterium]